MVSRHRLIRGCAAALMVSMVALAGNAHAARPHHVMRFNAPGNILISDQYNNRAIEIDPATGLPVWSFGSGDPHDCTIGPHHIIGLNDAERLADGHTLMVGTGIPAGAIPEQPSGCADNRIIVVDRFKNIVWQYGPSGINTPVFAIQLPNRNFMVVDQGNNRVIEIGRFSKTIVWDSSTVAHPVALNNPNSAELLPNGHILIADENNNRAIEITRDGTIVWQYADPQIKGLAFASRLPNGNTLMVDSGNSRVFEVAPPTDDDADDVVWSYFTDTEPGSNSSPSPTNAVRLFSGDTLIADQNNDRVLQVDNDKSKDFQYGMLNTPGNGTNQLYGPYTAFQIGDYLGQTPPPEEF